MFREEGGAAAKSPMNFRATDDSPLQAGPELGVFHWGVVQWFFNQSS